MKNIASTLAMLLIVLFISPVDGLGADKQQFCNTYADKAVTQYNLGKQHNLPGIVPPAWSNDRNGHYNWCMMAPENIVNSEYAKRQAYLDKNITKDNQGKGSVSEAATANLAAFLPKMAIVTGIVTGDSDSSYLGCFKDRKDRDISGFSFNAPNMTKDLCLEKCRQKGFSYAGLQYSRYCFCGNSYGKLGKANNCNMPCAGNKAQTCGGGWANSVYATGQSNGKVVQNSKEHFCKKYAQDAIHQVSLAKQHHLPNIVPPVWSNDRNGHYKWCMHTSKDAVNKGRMLRQNYLDKYIKENHSSNSVVTGAITGKVQLPDYRKIIAAMQPSKSMKFTKRDSMRQTIENKNGGKIEVIHTTPFTIPKGSLEVKYPIDVPITGLYKIHFNLNRTKSNIFLSPRIDMENYTYQIQSPNNNLGIPKTVTDVATAQKVGSGTYSPWIISDESINIYSSRGSDYYFWVDKEHLPASGKLQFRLEVINIENNIQSTHGEIGDPGFTPAASVDLKDHMRIQGNFNVEYSVPYKVTFNDQFNVKNAEIPYSIITLPSAQESGMAFSVIETPVVKLDRSKGSYESPLLSFFLANAEKLSSKPSPSESSSSEFIKKEERPNRWIYKQVLSSEYGQAKECNALALNGNSICSKEKTVKYDAWDAAQDYSGSFLYDVSNPPLGIYSIVVTNNPIYGHAFSLERFSTKGMFEDSGLVSGDNLRNEVIVATRNAAPMKWTYIAELTRLSISEQAEYDKDADDYGLGEFTLMTLGRTGKHRKENTLYEETTEWARSFPIVDNEDYIKPFMIRPSNFIQNVSGSTYPLFPLMVMDYESMSKYNDVAFPMFMYEHDKQTFWQKYGNAIKAMAKLFSDMGKMVISGGVDLASLTTTVYDFVTADDFNPNIKVDDYMGNAAIALFKISNFGLGSENSHLYNIVGPADQKCVNTKDISEGSGTASVTGSTCTTRNMSALITLRRIPQLDTRADIQLVNYTPSECPIIKFIPMSNQVEKCEKRTQFLTEGILSNNPISYTIKQFNNVESGQMVIVRDSKPSTTNMLNKGVITGSQWNKGRQTMKSQRWDGKGFTYYQATIEDYALGERKLSSVISFILYHEDVIKYAGEKDYRWFNTEKDYGGVMGLKSVKMPNGNVYKVNIKLRDPGDFIEEANFVAYVYVGV